MWTISWNSIWIISKNMDQCSFIALPLAHLASYHHYWNGNVFKSTYYYIKSNGNGKSMRCGLYSRETNKNTLGGWPTNNSTPDPWECTFCANKNRVLFKTVRCSKYYCSKVRCSTVQVTYYVIRVLILEKEVVSDSWGVMSEIRIRRKWRTIQTDHN